MNQRKAAAESARKLARSSRFLAKEAQKKGTLDFRGAPMPARYYLMRAERHETVAYCFERYPEFTGSGTASASIFEREYEKRRTVR